MKRRYFKSCVTILLAFVMLFTSVSELLPAGVVKAEEIIEGNIGFGTQTNCHWNIKDGVLTISKISEDRPALFSLSDWQSSFTNYIYDIDSVIFTEYDDKIAVTGPDGGFPMFFMWEITSVDLRNLNFSGVKNAATMFNQCKKLKSANLDGLITSNVTDMNNMFCGCSALESVSMKDWDTSKVTNMAHLFYECSQLTSLDLSQWNTSSVIDMEYAFYNCSRLTSLDIKDWDTSSVTTMTETFYNCNKLTSLDLSQWNTSNVTDMAYAFAYCSSLENLDLSGWDTSNVTSMGSLFRYCSSLESLDIGQWNTSNVTSMENVFIYCSSLKSLDLNGWVTSNATSMNGMFSECTSLENLDLSDWDTSEATDLSYFFHSCSSLTSVTLGSNFRFRGANISYETSKAFLPEKSSKYWTITLEDGSKLQYSSYQMRDQEPQITNPGTYTLEHVHKINISKSGTNSNSFDVRCINSDCPLPEDADYKITFDAVDMEYDGSPYDGFTYTIPEEFENLIRPEVKYQIKDDTSFFNDPPIECGDYRVIFGFHYADGYFDKSVEDFRDFSIVDYKLFGNAVVNLNRTEFAYDGNSHKPTVTTATYKGQNLVENTDFEVSGIWSKQTGGQLDDEDCLMPGEYELRLNGIGNYKGEKKIAFAITGVAIEGDQTIGNRLYLRQHVGKKAVSYQWCRKASDGTVSDISGETGSSYDVTGADAGFCLGAKITYSDGSIGESEYTRVITKQSAPELWVNYLEVRENSVKINVSSQECQECQVRLNNEAWKDMGIEGCAEYKNLDKDTDYEISVQLKETDTTYAGSVKTIPFHTTTAPSKEEVKTFMDLENKCWVSINEDYSDFTLEDDGDKYVYYEIMTDNLFDQYFGGDNDPWVCPETDLIPGKTYYARKCYDRNFENYYINEISPIFSFKAPERPKAPAASNFSIIDVTGEGNADGKILGLDESMEWKASSESEYVAYSSDNKPEGLDEGDYDIRFKATADYFESEPVRLHIGNSSVDMQGVYVSGQNYFGNTLTAVVYPSNANGSFSYQWYRSDGITNMPIGSGQTYRLTANDIGKSIFVTVSQTNGNAGTKTFTSAHTSTISPESGTGKRITLYDSNIVVGVDSIEVQNLSPLEKEDAYEYSCNGGETWQDSPVFSGLAKSVYYEIVVREKAVTEDEVVTVLPGAKSYSYLTYTRRATDQVMGVSVPEGDIRLSQTVYANITPSTARNFTVQWYRRDAGSTDATGMEIPDANNTGYQPTTKDYNKELRVVITQNYDGNTNTYSSGWTTPLKKVRAMTKLMWKYTLSSTTSSLEIHGYPTDPNYVYHYQYAVTDTLRAPREDEWQNFPRIEGLSSNTNYVFQVRSGGADWQETGDRLLNHSTWTDAKEKPYRSVPSVLMDDFTYGASVLPTPSLDAALLSGAGNVTYEYSADGKSWNAWDESVTSLQVGTYRIRGKIAESEDYASYVTRAVSFAIQKAKNVTPTVTCANVGTKPTVTVTGAEAGSVVSYAVKAKDVAPVDEDYRLTKLSGGRFTLEGLAADFDYDVYVRFPGDSNHTISDAGKSTGKTSSNYTVSYDVNNGVGLVASQTGTKGDAGVHLSTAAGIKRTGYTFEGWNTKPDGTGTLYAPGDTVTDGVRLYAKWTPITYKVSFDGNGAESGSMADQTFTYGTSDNLTNNTFTRTDYDFIGWALETEGPVCYGDGQKIMNLTTKADGTIALYAVWVLQTASIQGEIISRDNAPVHVTLKRGTVQVGELQEYKNVGESAGDYTQPYNFANVPNGVYNVVANQNVTRYKEDGDPYTLNLSMTIAVTIEGGHIVGDTTIQMPVEDTSSVLAVSGEDTPPIVVDGLSEEAHERNMDDRSVTMRMQAKKIEKNEDISSDEKLSQQSAIAAIEEKTSGDSEELEYYDFSLQQDVMHEDSLESELEVSQTNKTLKMIIPYNMKGKKSYQIKMYRCHLGQAELFERLDSKPTSDPGDGKFYPDPETNTVWVFGKLFSVYAIGFDANATEPAPSPSIIPGGTPSGGDGTPSGGGSIPSGSSSSGSGGSSSSSGSNTSSDGGGESSISDEGSEVPISKNTESSHSDDGKVDEKISIEKAKVILDKKTMVYTGKPLACRVKSVILGDKKIPSKDYTVSYQNNKNPGKATVIVKVKKSSATYTGKVKTTFKIEVSGTKNLKAVTKEGRELSVTAKKQEGAKITGYQICYRIKGKSKWKTVKVKSNKNLKTVLIKLNKNKKYQVKARAFVTISQKKYYGAWTKTITKKIS